MKRPLLLFVGLVFAPHLGRGYSGIVCLSIVEIPFGNKQAEPTPYRLLQAIDQRKQSSCRFLLFLDSTAEAFHQTQTTKKILKVSCLDLDY